jgi:hypothetical protein
LVFAAVEFIFRNGFDNINVGKGMIKAIVFDFGGVLAEEGFREGLKAIGQKNGLNPDDFYAMASELVYQTGYVTGVSDEYEFGMPSGEKRELPAAIKN